MQCEPRVLWLCGLGQAIATRHRRIFDGDDGDTRNEAAFSTVVPANAGTHTAEALGQAQLPVIVSVWSVVMGPCVRRDDGGV